MRFSENEKKIIRKIVGYDWSTFCTLDRFIGTELHFDLIFKPSQKCYWLYYDVKNNPKGKKERILDFFELYFLIKRLMKNDLIISVIGNNCDRFVGNQDLASSPGKVGVFKDGSYIDVDYKWKDKNGITIKDIITFQETEIPFGEMACGLPLISQELKDLVENDFKTEEQIRFSRQQFLTWVSIGVAFIIGLLGIFCK